MNADGKHPAADPEALLDALAADEISEGQLEALIGLLAEGTPASRDLACRVRDTRMIRGWFLGECDTRFAGEAVDVIVRSRRDSGRAFVVKTMQRVRHTEGRRSPPSSKARPSRKAGTRIFSYLVVALASAACVLVAFQMGLFQPSGTGSKNGPPGSVEAPSPGVEVLAATDARQGHEKPLQPGDRLHAGDAIVTGSAGRVQLRYADDTSLTLREKGELALLPGQALPGAKERSKSLELRAGELEADVAPQLAGQPLVIQTPQATATVVGTKFSLQVRDSQTCLQVTEGSVQLQRGSERLLVEKDMKALADDTGLRRADPAARPTDSQRTGTPGEPALMVDLAPGVEMELVLVKAGEFEMGSNDDEPNAKPAHQVKIGKPYYIGKYDVTVAQFRAFADATKYQTEAEKQDKARAIKDGKFQQEVSGVNWRSPGFKQEENHPVVVVSWNDVQEFCKWASDVARASGLRAQSEGLRYTFRLPTEAEWEYAARGPQSLKYPWGDKWEGLLANVADASLRRTGFNMQWGEIKEDDGYPFTSPGGAYKNASWCGAFDMAGNVWQWCQDFYGNNYYGESPAVDPPGPATGRNRVIRGSCWNYAPDACRSARRSTVSPGKSDAVIGFRVVVECGSSKAP